MRSRREVVDEFSRVYYDHRAYSRLSWRGVECVQYPTDLLVLADLIWRVRPSAVVETGSYMGGQALFVADLLDAMGEGQVITVDVADWSGSQGYPDHPRITYVRGSSVDPDVVSVVTDTVGGGTCLVVLDSDHSEAHVHSELEAYAPLVTVGSYVVVQDTNVHQVKDGYGPGPDDAVAKWIPGHPEFVVDAECERLLLTACPGGWLRRVR